jgi:BirA family transcriptional regulator, biotin operon repressor / biotin---[acetyl-CoA-carboxylase] ligase
VAEPAIRFGDPHLEFRRCESTNTRARELAAAGLPGGTVVTAFEQTGGRGRQGRSWIAPAGQALLYSAILRPLEERHTMLPLAVPIAVCETVEALGAGPAAVKWPNDVWLDGLKCAGVLIEARPQDGWAVIGVGLNVNVDPQKLPEELRGQSTSVGGRATVEAALEALNERLTVWAAAEPRAVRAAFGERDALRGREISWDGGSGVAEGIDESGNLLVSDADGNLRALGAGEVQLVRPQDS